MWLQITSAGSPKSFSEISGMIKNKAREKNNTRLQNNGSEWQINIFEAMGERGFCVSISLLKKIIIKNW